MRDAGQPAETDGGKPWIDEDGDESAEEDAGQEVEYASGKPAAERFVEEEEGRSVENEVIKRVVFPGESKPAGQFTFEKRGGEEIKCSGCNGKIDCGEQKNEEEEFGWVFEFHSA